MQSFGLSQNTCAIDSMLEMTLKCESMIPFGIPVLPLEKTIVAGSSGAAPRW